MRISILCLIILSSNFAFAKELSSRLGVGFRNAQSVEIPSIAAIYYPNSDIGFVGSIGIDTQDQNSKSAFGAGIRKIIFKEDNMNFFMGANFALVSSEVAGQTDSGYDLSGLVGGEFFLTGLDSLGFNFETGVGMSNVKKVRFRTLADHPFRAGIIFYF